MKIRELIESLSKFNPDIKLGLTSGGTDWNISSVCSGLGEGIKAKVVWLDIEATDD